MIMTVDLIHSIGLRDMILQMGEDTSEIPEGASQC